MQLRKETAVLSAINTNVNERRSSEPFYVNVPSTGLKGRQHDEHATGDNSIKSCSADSVVEEADSGDRVEMVITDRSDFMPVSDSQTCNCCIVS